MSTFKFLCDYINSGAKITVCKRNGDIIYTGVLREMPVRLIRNTVFVDVDGLGIEKDLIITVKERGAN